MGKEKRNNGREEKKNCVAQERMVGCVEERKKKEGK